MSLGRRRAPVQLANAQLALQHRHLQRLLQAEHAGAAAPLRLRRAVRYPVELQLAPAQCRGRPFAVDRPVQPALQAVDRQPAIRIGQVQPVGIEGETARTVRAQVQAAAQFAGDAHVAQAQRAQPGFAVALVGRREIRMQAVQPQALQRALRVEGHGAVELQRIGIVQPQVAQFERAVLRIRMQAQLHRVVRQLRVDRPQQQLAATQAGVQVDPRRARGGVETEAPAAAQPLSRQGAARGVEAETGEGELPGRLQAGIAQVQRQLGIQPAAGGTPRPYRAEQALQPAGGEIVQDDLRVGGLVQRQRGPGVCLALQDIDLQGVGGLAEQDVHMGVAERAARRAGQAHVAVEDPAQAGVPLQVAVEGQAQPPPAHRRNVGLLRAQLQPESAGGILAEAQGHRLQVDAGNADRLCREQHFRPRRQHPADPQQQAATQQEVA